MNFLDRKFLSPYLFFFVFLSFCFELKSQEFTADVTQGCAPLHVKFSTQVNGIYAWSFGKTSNNTSNIKEPSVTFDEPGLYTISLSIDGATPVTKTAFIKVYDLPKADFNVNYVPGCAPVDALFTNNSTSSVFVPITSYQWIFGDGSSYTTTLGSSISHTYNLPGEQIVTLVVKNENLPGCIAAKVSDMDSKILVYKIESKFTAQTFFCSAPAPVQFENSSSGPGLLTYSWDFGGLVTSSDQSPQFQFNGLGNYDVKLTVKGDYNCSATSTQVIHVGTNAFAITSDKDKVCVGDNITFNVTQGSYLNSWAWSLGDNITPAPLLEQKVKYTDPGIYTIRLNADAGDCTIGLTKTIQVVGLPVPLFSTTPKCDKTIKFNNSSINAIGWVWDFGDGTTSPSKNPEHIYPTAGTYSVKLRAINSLGCAVDLDSPVQVQVFDNPVAAIFPSLETSCNDEPILSGCAPFTIRFESFTGTGLPIATTSWNFGDGRTSMLSNPIITYSVPGTYTVTLSLKAVAGCTSSTMATVTIYDPTQVTIPTIMVNNNDVCVGQEVNIKTSPTVTYPLCWELEPGKFSSGNELNYIFSSIGDHDIKIRVPGCTISDVFTHAVTVKEPSVQFALSQHCGDPSNTSAPSSYQVDFFNTSTNKAGLTYIWDFGDGTSSADRNPPRHEYPIKPDESIDYIVSLGVADPSTNCSATVITTINIHQLVADFSIRDIPAGNTDPLKSIKVCKNDVIQFTDQSHYATTWLWYFDDPSVPKFEQLSDQQNPTYTYKNAGTYEVSLLVSDGYCIDSKVLSIPITVPDLEGKFSFQANSSCDALEVQFTDQSTALPAAKEWKWDFGNGDTSIEQNPKYTYQTLGTYYINLTVGNDNGECTVPLESGLAFTRPIIDFSVNRPFACIDENLIFNQNIQFTSAISWDFGNGIVSNSFNPNTAYKAVGQYPVTLAASDNYGCSVTNTKPNFITITKPKADFEFDKIIKDCPPLITSFTDKSEDAVKWLWSFGDGQNADTKNPVNTYVYPGIYSVSLQVTDQNNCTDSKVIPELITIKGPTGIFQNTNSVNCTNDSTYFSSVYNEAVSVQWDFGDGVIEQNINNTVAHLYSVFGKVQPLILLKDDKGCEVLFKTTNEITISKSPESDFEYSPLFPFEGEEITFHPISQGYQFSWDFKDEMVFNQDTIVKVFNEPGKKIATLEIKDSATGCNSKLEKVIDVQGYPDLIPNVFTGNQDEWNPTFTIKGIEKSDWSLVVYNRWGEPVYKNPDYQNDWTGEQQSPGIYYYKLQNIYRKDKSYVGYIQLIK